MSRRMTSDARWRVMAMTAALIASLQGCATQPEDLPPPQEASCAPQPQDMLPGLRIAPEDASPHAITPLKAQAATQVTQPPQPATAPQTLQGQLSIKLQAFGKTPAKGISLGFFFSGTEGTGQLDLITLMGSQMAQVNWTPAEVWLTDDKGRHRYDSMETLSEAALGEALPLRALVHWMQGRPDPSLPGSAPTKEGFSQLGWTIDTRELAVKKLTATREGTASQRGAFVKVYLDR